MNNNMYPPNGAYGHNYALDPQNPDRPIYEESEDYPKSQAPTKNPHYDRLIRAERAVIKIKALPLIGEVLAADLGFKNVSTWAFEHSRHTDLADEVTALVWLLEQSPVLELLDEYQRPEEAA